MFYIYIIMNSIETIERAILPEDFFPQYDNIYYKNLLRQYLYKIYKCNCDAKKEIDKFDQQILTRPKDTIVSPQIPPSTSPILPSTSPIPPTPVPDKTIIPEFINNLLSKLSKLSVLSPLTLLPSFYDILYKAIKASLSKLPENIPSFISSNLNINYGLPAVLGIAEPKNPLGIAALGNALGIAGPLQTLLNNGIPLEVTGSYTAALDIIQPLINQQAIQTAGLAGYGLSIPVIIGIIAALAVAIAIYLKYKNQAQEKQIDYRKLEETVSGLLDYYNQLVKIYTEIHNEKKDFEDKIKPIIGTSIVFDELTKLDFQKTIYKPPFGGTDYEKIKSLIAMGKILVERINKLEIIIRKYLYSNLDFEKIVPSILTGGNDNDNFTSVDNKLGEIKKMIDGLDFDLKNLLKFKSQIRVTEDEYLNQIKTMRVKLEKNVMENPTKEYRIEMNNKDLVNLGDSLKLDSIKADEEVIKDIQSQISQSHNIGNFEKPKMLDFNFDMYNVYKDQLQDVYKKLYEISESINKKIEELTSIKIDLTFIPKLNYQENKLKYDEELKINSDVISYAKFVLNNKEIKIIPNIDELKNSIKSLRTYNPNLYTIDNGNLKFLGNLVQPKNILKVYYESIPPPKSTSKKQNDKIKLEDLLVNYNTAYKLLITDYEGNIDRLRRNINDIQPKSVFTSIFNIKDKQKVIDDIIKKEKEFIIELGKYKNIKVGGSKTNFSELNTTIGNIAELIEFTNKLKSVTYIFEIIKNILTNIEKIIEIISSNLYDYLNLLVKYINKLKTITESSNINNINDFYFLSEIKDVKDKILLIPDDNENKLYKKLCINVCKYFIDNFKEDKCALIVDNFNYIYLYLINI